MFRIKSTDKYKKIVIMYGLLSIKIDMQTLEMAVRFIGLKIITSRIKNNNLIYKLNIEIPFFVQNVEKISAEYLYKNVRKYYKKNYDSIYSFLQAPSGEIYILLNIFDKILKENNSKIPLIVVNEKFKKDLCELLRPDIPVILSDFLQRIPICKSYKQLVNNCPIYTFFPVEHYQKQDVLIKEQGEHYYSYITGVFDIKNCDFKEISIPKEVQQRIRKYVSENNWDRFVILAPEANTCSTDFADWREVCKELKQNGYKVLLNITKANSYVEGTIPIIFTYAELLELSKYASSVVGVRSGLMEILSNNRDLELHILYTDIPKRGELKEMSAANALSGFTIKKIPDVNQANIHEYTNFSELQENLRKSMKRKCGNVILQGNIG